MPWTTTSHQAGDSTHALFPKPRSTSVPSVAEAQLQGLQHFSYDRPRSFSTSQTPQEFRAQRWPQASSRDGLASTLVNRRLGASLAVNASGGSFSHSPSPLQVIPEDILSLFPSEHQSQGRSPRSPLNSSIQDDQTTRASSRRSSAPQPTTNQESMSTFGYAYAPAMEHFPEAPKFHSVLPSSFPEYNTIQVPHVQVDGSHSHLDHQSMLFPSGEFVTSPSLAFPKTPDPEMIRQRRQSYNERRASKGRMRTQRSQSSAFLPSQTSMGDDGTGMTTPTTPVGIGHRHSVYAGNYTNPRAAGNQYAEHHQVPQYHVSGLEIPLSVDTSHAIYQPSPIPSSADSMDAGRQMDRYTNNHLHRSPSNAGPEEHVRVVASRPKPQCWDHGCNGRQFSTFSNLLRHQRERAGTATKSYCPNCGAEFTRTTARNGHMAHEKCKPRRNS
ncbi:MAG: hypothetical protein M1825_001744 [Sarcosagium campestre]|nr:MAG: hypothetical protein M1825_001744 [Sarcosagium campestre]